MSGTRDASQVLGEVKPSAGDAHLRQLRTLVDVFWDIITSEDKDIRILGEVLDYGWQCKKRMSEGISNPVIDGYYTIARQAGALGGKLLGAGSTGFLMLFCEPGKQDAVRSSLGELRHIPFEHSPEGSKIIYVGDVSWPSMARKFRKCFAEVGAEQLRRAADSYSRRGNATARFS